MTTLPEDEREEDLSGADLAGWEDLDGDREKDDEDLAVLRGAEIVGEAERDLGMEKLDPEDEEGDLRGDELSRLQLEENEGACGLVSLGRLLPNDDTLREELLDNLGPETTGSEAYVLGAF